MEHVKTEGFSLDDTVERLKRVVALVDKMVVTPIVASVKPGELVDVTEGEAAEEADDDDAEAPTGEVRGFGSPKSPSGVALAVASTVAVAVSVSIAAKTTEALTLDM